MMEGDPETDVQLAPPDGAEEPRRADPPEEPPLRVEAAAPETPVVNARPEPAPPAADPATSLFVLPQISADAPCGPDLDSAGDLDFMNFLATTEGVLPGKTEEYYRFDRVAADVAGSIRTGEKLLARTLDVRLLVLLAKLTALNRDLEGFARRVGNLAWLIETHWEDANPKADGGDYGLRLAQLDTLDTNAAVLLPLQYAPLIESGRESALSYRDNLLASGAEKPRSIIGYSVTGEKGLTAPEKFMAANTIQRVLSEVDLARLKGLFDLLTGLAGSVRTIRAVTMERAGPSNTIQLEKLSGLVGGMTEFLRGSLVKRDPSLAPPPEPAPGEVAGDAPQAGPTSPPPAFATRADVDAALIAALGYFTTREPTSPAFLLIRQARDTLGKNLYEVMKLLTPPHADTARVFVGPDSAFTIPVKSLSGAPISEPLTATAEPAASREAALALMDAVAIHMRRAEPSSPVPYLLERARNLATRDFLSLLQEVLPDEAIAALKKGK
jgi:type VI secretion system protein ImpA